MKKITCIQQFVIDSLLKEGVLSINSIIDAASKVCSEGQFNCMLSVLIESSIYSTLVKEKKISDLVKVLIYIPEEYNIDNKMRAIKIIKERYGLGLKEAKDYIDECIGRYKVIPKTIKFEEAIELRNILSPLGIDVAILYGN